MLNKLFTSKVRVKLLSLFLLNPESEFYVREITRKLEEQINAVRRELENLKKIGLLKCKNRNRRKYYLVNENFIFFNDLRNLFAKAENRYEELISSIDSNFSIDYLLLSGVFLPKESPIDLLIVGEIDKDALADFLDRKLDFKDPVRFTVLSKENFLYRYKCNDRFLNSLLKDNENIIALNRLEKYL